MNIIPCPWSGTAAMYEEALQHFGSLNKQVDAEVELHKIKMKAGESVAEFNLQWDLVVEPSGWTGEALIALYRDALTDEIFDLCTNSDPIPITLEEWRSKADQMDWAKRANMARNFNRRQAQHTTSQPRPQGTSVIPTQRLGGMVQALSQLPRAPQWQSPPPQQQRQLAQGYTPPKHDIKTPSGTTFGGRERDMDIGRTRMPETRTCHICKKPRHILWYCPDRKDQKRQWADIQELVSSWTAEEAQAIFEALQHTKESGDTDSGFATELRQLDAVGLHYDIPEVTSEYPEGGAVEPQEGF
ncbi:hypothetical protein AX16_002124 [Volvariella volvacea WC 439]|nr:hypothetical protein AX16_002124 [Volvariella volvacea WC 439]